MPEELAVVDEIPVQALMEVSIVAHLADVLFARHLPEGITTAQFGVLNRLVRLDLDETLSEVAAAFRVTRATMSSTVEKLERKQLITLSRCRLDGRQRRIAITPQGREVRAQGVEAQLTLIARYGEFVSEAQWRNLASILGQIRFELEAATNGREG